MSRYLRFMILLIFPFLIHSQDDPLLRRPWISTAIEEEERSFNKVQSSLLSRPHFLVSKDRWGRSYKTMHDGKVEYLLDETYAQKFPDAKEPYLALAEAKTLMNNKHWIPAYHLLEGLLLCFRDKQNSFYSQSMEIEATKFKNEILSKNYDKKHILSIIADPYGCIKDENASIESKAFLYKLNIPSDWNYEYVRDPEAVSDINDTYSARYQRFYKILDENPNTSFEDQYILSEQGLNKIRKRKLIFFIGSLYQKQNVFNKNNFYKIWDFKRGLNNTTLREWKLKRKVLEPGYSMELQAIDERGKKISIIMREYYYWKRNRGIFISFSYPQEESDEMENTWKNIVSSIVVKE
ncbi:MAG: hypothetical protein JJT78_10050 [Leptospira sp.]|nr:hypothetical protein [Leptospira sp.]